MDLTKTEQFSEQTTVAVQQKQEARSLALSYPHHTSQISTAPTGNYENLLRFFLFDIN